MLQTQGCYRLFFWEANLSDSSGAWMADVKDATKVPESGTTTMTTVILWSFLQRCWAQFWTMLDFTALRLQSPCIVDVIDILLIFRIVDLVAELLIFQIYDGSYLAVVFCWCDWPGRRCPAGFQQCWLHRYRPGMGRIQVEEGRKASKNITIFQLDPHYIPT